MDHVQEQETKKAIGGYFQDPWGTSSDLAAPTSLMPNEMHGQSPAMSVPQHAPPGPKPGAADSDPTENDTQKNSKWAQKRKVSFVQDGDRTTPALAIRFDESSAELTPQAKEQLNRFIPTLVGKANKLEIRGHSTRRPLPSDSGYHDLWQLCYARCQAVMNYLEEHGVEPDRLRLSQSAAFEPVTRRVETTWQSENSRVELFLLNELKDAQPGTQQAVQEAAAKTGEPEGKDSAAPAG